jgi:hypothetical protein
MAPSEFVSAGEAEARITSFFKASSKTRGGLNLACPFCQAAVVVRIRGRDGRAFLGCTKYPSCSGSWDVPDAAQEEAKSWERQLMTPAHTGAMLPDVKPQEDLDDMIDEAIDGAGLPLGRTAEIRGKPSYARGFRRLLATKEMSIPGVPLRIPRGAVFHFDGSTLLLDGTSHHVPQLKGCLSAGWIQDRGPSLTEDVEGYLKKETKMKEAMDEAESPISTMKARLARSAMKAPYRMARMRALTSGKKALLSAAKSRVKPATFDIIEAFLETDAGQGAIIGLLGLAGPMTPKLGKNKHVQALCDEFLEEGVAKGFNQVLSIVAMIVEPALETAIAEMPGVDAIADKVVPKRRKKRVATSPDVRVSTRKPEPEADDDAAEEPRPKNALRAIG